MLDCRSTQDPLQLEVFPPHVSEHVPELHEFGDAQAVPQAPQLSGSVFSLTQAPAQTWRPVWHERAHMPPAQT